MHRAQCRPTAIQDLISESVSFGLSLFRAAFCWLNSISSVTALRTGSRLCRPYGTNRATGFSCLVMMTSSLRATFARCLPNRVFASNAVTLSKDYRKQIDQSLAILQAPCKTNFAGFWFFGRRDLLHRPVCSLAARCEEDGDSREIAPPSEERVGTVLTVSRWPAIVKA
jgi:hypothetical protein